MQIGCRGLAAAAVGFDIKGKLLPLVKAAHAGAPEALLFRLSLLARGDVEVELCHPVFVDPERVRLNG